jgi:predicted DNA binding protein
MAKQSPPRGNAKKLTPGQVRDIREALSYGAVMQDLAKRFGVSRVTIWQIKHRKSWRACQ